MSSNCRHPQIYDMVEGANPGIRTRSCKSGRFGVVVARKVETPRVMGGGARRVWEGFHPRIESGSERRLGMERDAIEKVDSCPRNPGLGNEAAFPERSWCIVQVVDDVVEDLWWEEERHRGFRQNGANRRCLRLQASSRAAGCPSLRIPLTTAFAQGPNTTLTCFLQFACA